jgi:hypothetical protein
MSMTLGRALFAVGLSTAICVAAGVGLGAFVGTVAPDYYGMWYRNGLPSGLDPIQIGIGNGVGAGAVAGIVIGLVIVFILARSELRREAARSVRVPDWEREPHAAARPSDAVQRRSDPT